MRLSLVVEPVRRTIEFDEQFEQNGKQGMVNKTRSRRGDKKVDPPDVVKSARDTVTDLKSKEVVEMVTRERLIEKIKSLPEDKLGDVANFVEFLEAKGEGQSELAECGMGDYLAQLLAYEEMLAAGKIKWR